MKISRSPVWLLAAVTLAACTTPGEERDLARSDDRRRCLMQSPTELETCLQRVEQEYVARQGMAKVDAKDAATAHEIEDEPAGNAAERARESQ